MKKLKDFFYDKNDIFLAVLILLVATLIIFWRLNSIMDYPQALAADAETQKTVEKAKENSKKAEEKKTKKENEAKNQEDSKSNDSKSKDNQSGIWNGSATSKDITVTIESGSLESAVNSLISAGLFDSYEEFTSICASQGIDPGSIKASTFTFPAGSSKADIAKKVTQ